MCGPTWARVAAAGREARRVRRMSRGGRPHRADPARARDFARAVPRLGPRRCSGVEGPGCERSEGVRPGDAAHLVVLACRGDPGRIVATLVEQPVPGLRQGCLDEGADLARRVIAEDEAAVGVLHRQACGRDRLGPCLRLGQIAGIRRLTDRHGRREGVLRHGPLKLGDGRVLRSPARSTSQCSGDRSPQLSQEPSAMTWAVWVTSLAWASCRSPARRATSSKSSSSRVACSIHQSCMCSNVVKSLVNKQFSSEWLRCGWRARCPGGWLASRRARPPRRHHR